MIATNHSFKQYRASQRHGDATIEPGFESVGGVVAENRRRWNASEHGGNPLVGDATMLAALRPRARKQMIEDSLRYTSAYRDVEWARGRLASFGSDLPTVFMAGHQPTIFHPGVWFKNFALSHLGAVHGALPINLVIDNDVSDSSSIRVPSIDHESGEVRRVRVAYDDAGGGVPFEQTTIQDLEAFDQFDASVVRAMGTRATGDLGDDSCIMPLWKHARAAVARCGVAGCALAQARHGLEADVGLRTLELPLGVLCRGSAFAEFLLTILTDLPRFQACYNDQTDLYRAAHGIRSSAHPVPHLEADDQWVESPLWVYGNDSPTRKPVWAKRTGNELILSDSPGANDSPAARSITIDVSHRKLAAEQLANLVDPNFKLRPRALITTMYARLILSDLFLHGIGGGKYDQLGDRIIESFYGVTPPEFMVISATILLPQARGDRETSQTRALKRKIRETYYQPERWIGQTAAANSSLVTEKQELLARIPASGSRKAWHDRVSEINARLSTDLEPLRDDLRRQLAEAEKAEADQEILASREHPFCVFELDDLVQTYRQMLA